MVSSVFRKTTSDTSLIKPGFVRNISKLFYTFICFYFIYHIVILYPLTSFSDRLLYHYAMFCFCKYIFIPDQHIFFDCWIPQESLEGCDMMRYDKIPDSLRFCRLHWLIINIVVFSFFLRVLWSIPHNQCDLLNTGAQS